MTVYNHQFNHFKFENFHWRNRIKVKYCMWKYILGFHLNLKTLVIIGSSTFGCHILTEKNKLDRVSVANSLLARLNKDPCLDQLIKSDEKWIVYNPTDTNMKTIEWIWSISSKSQSLHRKCIPKQLCCISIWWDCKSVIFYKLLIKRSILTSIVNKWTNWKPQFIEKRLVFDQSESIGSHHHNVRP